MAAPKPRAGTSENSVTDSAYQVRCAQHIGTLLALEPAGQRSMCGWHIVGIVSSYLMYTRAYMHSSLMDYGIADWTFLGLEFQVTNPTPYILPLISQQTPLLLSPIAKYKSRSVLCPAKYQPMDQDQWCVPPMIRLRGTQYRS